ncbi:MAG: hypothetical protein MRY74_03770 [Neomegalonema sp.]|nr:hypothetical protein [Neomegalonema sp.]
MNDASSKEQETTELLVSYAANSATAAQRAAIEARAAADPDFAARLALTLSSKEALAASESAEHAEWSPGAFGFQRLMREVEREAPQPQVRWIDSLNMWRGIAAAAAVALVAVSLWRFDSAAPGAPPGYGLAADGPTSAASLQLTFAPSASEENMRALLLKVGGRFIDGPSLLGVYRIGFESKKARDAAVSTILADKIVESAAAE